MIEVGIYDCKVILDEEIWNNLKQFTWCIAWINGLPYAVRSINRKRRYMHHDVIGKPPIGMITDHIDRNTLHNWKENLRHITYKENARNSYRNSTSTFVHFEKGRYRARPRLDGIVHNVGSYKTEIEALDAVKDFFNAV